MASLYQCSSCLFASPTMEDLVNHICLNPPFNESEESSFVGEDICAAALQQAGASTSTAESPKFLERWEDNHVRLLISSYSKFKDLFGRGKTTKKEVFNKICAEFNAISDHKVTVEQCMRKWAKLEIKLKEIEDNNNQTGRARKSWKFQEDMTECIGVSPKIKPGFTFDTSSSSNSGTNQCDSDGEEGDTDGDEERKKKVKMPRKKRKSKSSAGEMLEFLQSYSEKREKVEEEKLAVLKSMKEDKKEFFSQFLDVLKNK